MLLFTNKKWLDETVKSMKTTLPVWLASQTRTTLRQFMLLFPLPLGPQLQKSSESKTTSISSRLNYENHSEIKKKPNLMKWANTLFAAIRLDFSHVHIFNE